MTEPKDCITYEESKEAADEVLRQMVKPKEIDYQAAIKQLATIQTISPFSTQEGIDAITHLLFERDALKTELNSIRLVCEEAPLRVPELQFIVCKGSDVYRVPPDAVENVYEAIRDEVRKLGDWSAYDAWQKATDEIGRLKGEMFELRKELDQEIKKLDEVYRKGWEDGVTLFAWWKDGVQYVGTCGNTLKKALEEIMPEHSPQEENK